MRGARRGPFAFGLRLVFIAAVLGAWELAVTAFDVPAFLVPAPSKIAYALYQGIATGVYAPHITTTVIETLVGFAIGSLLALGFGATIAMSRRVEYYLYPFIIMFQAVPKVALVPLMVIWFGIGIASKIMSAALVAFFPLMVNTVAGLRSADEDRINLMRSLGASRWQILRMLRLPSALPFVFAGLEIAMIFALIGAIVAELSNAEKGLGMMMQAQTFTMDVAGQFSIVVILGILGLVLNGAVGLARRKLLFWDRTRDGDAEPATKGDL